MKKNIIILSLAALSLTGCGVTKTYNREKVAQPIATDNIYGDALSGDSLGLGDLKWRELFTDPTLQALIERVLEQNTNMKNADLAIQQVEYALKAAKMAFAPSISLTAQGSVSKMWDPYDRAGYSNIPNSKPYNIGLVRETTDFSKTGQHLSVVDFYQHIHIEKSEYPVGNLHKLKLIKQ